MTADTIRPQADVLLTLCCECGNTRTVSRRAAGFDGVRRLQCSVCGRSTVHAAVGAGWGEYAEEQNRKVQPTLSIEDQLDMLRSLGARVYEYTRDPTIIASVEHYLDDDTFHVDYNPAVDPAELAKHLDIIIKWVTKPGDQRWFVSKDEDGVAYASAEWSV